MALRIITALIIFALATPLAYAQTDEGIPAQDQAAAIGTIIEAEGPITITRQKSDMTNVKINDPVYLNDSIQTAPGGRAFILLIDDTELTLGEDSQLTIDEYVYDEQTPSANKGGYSVLRGAFLYTSGLLAKTDNPDVTVNTPYASIGIRGTTFWGGMIDDEYGVLVKEGRVSVQTERGRIFVEKDQGTFIRSKTSIPSRASTWGAAKTERAVGMIALKDAAAVRERVKAHAPRQMQARDQYKEFLKDHMRKQQLDQRGPVRRIENAPRLQEGPAPEGIQKPQRPDIQKPQDGNKAGTLLKAAPTRVNKEQPPTQEKPARSEPLPAVKGDNDAHTNELKEQQHMRRQPVIRQNQNRPQQQPKRSGPSNAAGAL